MRHDDDSLGFAALEREHVRRFVPEFDWLRIPEPSPRVHPRSPLPTARIGLVSTAGAHLPGERPIRPDAEVRLLPAEADVVLHHPGYDTERASGDLDVVYPAPLLRRLADDGVIGSLAPTVISMMGFIPDGRAVLERAVPVAVDRLRNEQVDLTLLVPA